MRFRLYVPDFALIELKKYKDVIKKKLANQQIEFEIFALMLFSNLNVISDFLLSNSVIEKAEELCQDVDIKDSLYVALAIFLNTTLITRDKPLYNHLKSKGFENVVLFDEFINIHITPENES